MSTRIRDWSVSAWWTASMCLPGADQQRPARVPRLLEQPSRQPQMQLAQPRDVDHGEEQRAEEDVVAREVFAAGQREHQRDHRRIEEGRGDRGEARPPWTVGVEVGAGEHQHRDQERERDVVLRLRPRQMGIGLVVEDAAGDQRGEQRPGDADEVQHQQRHDPGRSAGRLEPEQERQRGGTLASDIALGHVERHGVSGELLPLALRTCVVGRHVGQPLAVIFPSSPCNGIWNKRFRGRTAPGPPSANPRLT